MTPREQKWLQKGSENEKKWLPKGVKKGLEQNIFKQPLENTNETDKAGTKQILNG